MKDKELDEALSRALEYVFQDFNPIIQTFNSVFQTYPIELIEKIGIDALEKTIMEVSEWRAVREMREGIDLELEFGQLDLERVVTGIILNNLPGAGIIPQNKVRSYQKANPGKVYTEIEALRLDGETPVRIARGLFPEDSHENIVFTPRNVFYTEGLEWTLGSGGIPQLSLEGRVFYRRSARTIVFKDDVSDRDARAAVKAVIKYAVDQLHRGTKIKKRPYQQYENELIRSLLPLFPDVINKNRSINYSSVYDIFELVRRRNITLDGIMSDGGYLGKLNEGIHKSIALPYAVVSTRVKQKERAFDKIIEAIYDLKMPNKGAEGDDTEHKKFTDLYGIKCVVRDKSHIYRLSHEIGNTLGMEVIEEEDWIERIKKVGGKTFKLKKEGDYEGYHMLINFSGRTYEVQIRTHEMDMMAERGIGQAHDSDYLIKKKELIDSVPFAVRRFIAGMLGIYRPVAEKQA